MCWLGKQFPERGRELVTEYNDVAPVFTKGRKQFPERGRKQLIYALSLSDSRRLEIRIPERGRKLIV